MKEEEGWILTSNQDLLPIPELEPDQELFLIADQDLEIELLCPDSSILVFGKDSLCRDALAKVLVLVIVVTMARLNRQLRVLFKRL